VLLPKVGDKNAQKLHAAAADHARLVQADLIDILDTDDVKSKVPKDAKEEWPKFAASLAQVAGVMKSMKPHNAVDVAIDGWYGDYLKGAYANYVSRLDDLKSLVGFAGRFEDMHEMLTQIMLLNSETSDRSVDPDDEALRLTTVHQAKGLEYAAVFLIGLADGAFPLRRAIEAGDIEEERRLFYVAVTRAQDQHQGRAIGHADTQPVPHRGVARAVPAAPAEAQLWLVSSVYPSLRPRRTARASGKSLSWR
jgi:DNA helicase-2/ATP-dependent DNA helicase PcrA